MRTSTSTRELVAAILRPVRSTMADVARRMDVSLGEGGVDAAEEPAPPATAEAIPGVGGVLTGAVATAEDSAPEPRARVPADDGASPGRPVFALRALRRAAAPATATSEADSKGDHPSIERRAVRPGRSPMMGAAATGAAPRSIRVGGGETNGDEAASVEIARVALPAASVRVERAGAPRTAAAVPRASPRAITTGEPAQTPAQPNAVVPFRAVSSGGAPGAETVAASGRTVDAETVAASGRTVDAETVAASGRAVGVEAVTTSSGAPPVEAARAPARPPLRLFFEASPALAPHATGAEGPPTAPPAAAERVARGVAPIWDEAHRITHGALTMDRAAVPEGASPAIASPRTVSNTFNVNVSVDPDRGEAALDRAALEQAIGEILRDAARRHGLEV
jgi:hypothetical protein